MKRWTGPVRCGVLVWIAWLSLTPSPAAVTVDLDKATLNEILGAVAIERVEVPVSTGSLLVELRDLRVVGLLPAKREGQRHAIRTAVTVVAPDVGVSVPLQPLVALEVVEQAGVALLELRFVDLGFNVPLMGPVNVASVVPPMRYPATNRWSLDGARGPVPLTSRLSSIEMDGERIRFVLDVEVDEDGGGGPATGRAEPVE